MARSLHIALDPRRFLHLESFFDAYGYGLSWLLGLFERWGELDTSGAFAWSFVSLEHDGMEAFGCGDGGRTGWWAVVAREPEAAVELFERVPGLRRARRLSAAEPTVHALLAHAPEWAERAREPLRLLALRRPVMSFRDLQIEGFRTATTRDLESLMKFDLAPAGEPAHQTRSVLYTRIRRGRVFVVESAGLPVAMGELLPAGRVWDIQRVGTLPSARRQGFARRLLQGMLLVADQARVPTTLCVGEDNLPAQALYLSAGFQQVGVRVDLTVGERWEG